MSRKRLILARAVLREVIPTLVLATGVTTFLLLIRAIFMLADLFISRGASGADALRVIGYTLPNILVLTVPIGALFATLMTSSRLSSDSELVALQSSGVHLWRAAKPLLAVGLVLAAADAFLYLQVMPAANRRLELIRARILLSAAQANLEPRVFIESYDRYLLFINKIDRETGSWQDVLLFDNSSPAEERLIVADTGELVRAPDRSTVVRLGNAVSHVLRPDRPDRYTTTENRELEILLDSDHNQTATIGSSIQSTTTARLLERLRDPGTRAEDRQEARIELHRRIAIPVAAAVFAFIAFPLGVRNRRGGKSFGLTLSVGVVVLYYVLLEGGSLLAQSGTAPVWLGVWLPNVVLVLAGALLLKRASRGVPARGAGAWWWPRVADALRLRRRRSPSPAPAGAARPTRPCLGPERNGRPPLPPLLGRIDRYVLARCFGFLALVLVLVSAISVVIELSEDLGDIHKNNVELVVVASKYFFKLPQIFHDVLPLAFLIAFLGTAAVLERNNESTALKAAGVSLTRVTLPLLIAGLALGAVLFVVDDAVVQRANRTVARLHDMIKGRQPVRAYSDRPWLFLPDGRTLVNFLQYDPDTNSLLRPSVYVFDESFDLRSRYQAQRALFREGRWEAEHGWERILPVHGDPILVTEVPALPITVGPGYFGREYRRPSQMSFNELRSYVKTLQTAGYRVDRYRVQLHYKLAYPLSMFVLAWLAMPLAFRAGRARNLMVGVAVALVLGMVYFALTAIANKLGETGLLPAAAAAWTPTVVFALLAMNRHTRLQT